jgi:hypothetical protein
MNFLNEELIAKWKPVLEHPDLARITDTHKRNVTAVILENTERAIKEQQSFNPQSLMELSPANAAGTGGYAGAGGTGVAGYDPILISLVRRAMPNLIAYDVCGVQPMTGPTGLSSQCVLTTLTQLLVLQQKHFTTKQILNSQLLLHKLTQSATSQLVLHLVQQHRHLLLLTATSTTLLVVCLQHSQKH